LDSLPLAGIFTTYGGGGYVIDLTGTKEEILANLDSIKANNWLDRRTRSLLIEFNVYNPNVNLFAVCTLAIEILATGNFINTVTIEVINLFGQQSAVSNGIYYAYIGLSYFGQKLLTSFGKNNGQGYISFRYLNFYNSLLSLLLALPPALATLKFIKLLRFNKTVLLLTHAISSSMGQLLGVILIFFILFISFVQIFYLLLSNNLSGFKTVINTAMTCFQILLGKFEII